MVIRRNFMKLVGGASASVLLPGAAIAQRRPMVYACTGGATAKIEQECFVEPVSKALKIDIRVDGTMTPAKVEAMVRANAVEWDIVNFTGGFLHAGTEKGLLMPLDRVVVDQSVLEPALRHDYGTYTHCGGVVMAWNTRKYAEDKGPQSWADFFDVKKFPGSRAMYKANDYLCEASLRAAGLKLEEVYPLTDEKMKIVFAKLKEFKPHVSLWYTQGAVPAQALATGQVDLALSTTGRMLVVKAEGAPVAFTMMDGLINCFALMIPKGSTPYAKEAMQLMATSLGDAAQTKLLSAGAYGPVRASVIGKATPEQRKYLAFAPEHRKHMLVVNYAESARIGAKYASEWTNFFAG
jgi:putative spermidine/putrescine transport system substrate-binding protein